MACPLCCNTGYRTVERVPYGNPSDVEQVVESCACNPEPTDADAPGFDYSQPTQEWDEGYGGYVDPADDFDSLDDRCACNPEPTDEEHPLYETYCEDYGDHIGSWQNDTAEYRRLHMPRFPSFRDWLNAS